MNKTSTTMGLKQQIQRAGTLEEVDRLIKAGLTTYQNPTKKTVRAWKRTANQRVTELDQLAAETTKLKAKKVKKDAKKD